MKKHFLLCLFCLYLMCQQVSYGADSMNNQYIPADYVVISQQIRTDVATRLTKRYNMKLVGVTGGLVDYVNVLGLEFQIQGPLTRDELRKILVDCVEEFLVSINTNKQLRPFLKNYPFTANEIILKLYVINENGTDVYDPYVSVASEHDGKIVYKTEEKGNPCVYKSKCEETYEVARNIVRETKPSN